MKKFNVLILSFIIVTFTASTVWAQFITFEGRKYYLPTFQNFSKLYWALSKFETSNDEAIDNFMKINECGIYSDFIKNEFEWRKIRETARQQLEQKKADFPLRFEILIPAEVGEYNFDTQSFEVKEDFRIEAKRRFEILATDYKEPVCEDRYQIPGYPNGILIELSRPFVFKKLDVKPEIAKAFVDKKLAPYKDVLQSKGGANTQIKRDVSIFMKIKFFAERGEVRPYNNTNAMRAKVLGVLEAVEVYDNPQKELLLYAENYREKRQRVRKMKDLQDLSKTDQNVKTNGAKDKPQNGEIPN